MTPEIEAAHVVSPETVRVERTLRVWHALYPDGIPPGAYRDALTVADIARGPLPPSNVTAGELKAPREERAYVAAPLPLPSPPRWLTISDVAELAKTSRPTIYFAVKKGVLATHRRPEGRRVSREDAERFAATRKRRGRPPASASHDAAHNAAELH